MNPSTQTFVPFAIGLGATSSSPYHWDSRGWQRELQYEAPYSQPTTEPFWQQYPLPPPPPPPVARLPLYPTPNMDHEPVVIGFNSSFAAARTEDSPRRQPTELVEIRLGGRLLRPMPLKTLVRFSGAARRRFPAPPPGVQRMPDTDQPKRFEVSLEGTVLPTKAAVEVVLGNMYTNKHQRDLHHFVKLEPPTLAGEETPLSFLLEVYQVALAFELQPAALHMDLKKEILSRISKGKMQPTTFGIIVACMPLSDPRAVGIVCRAINIIWDYRDEHSTQELDAFNTIVLGDERLAEKVRDIYQERQRKEATPKKRKSRSKAKAKQRRQEESPADGPGQGLKDDLVGVFSAMALESKGEETDVKSADAADGGHSRHDSAAAVNGTGDKSQNDAFDGDDTTAA